MKFLDAIRPNPKAKPKPKGAGKGGARKGAAKARGSGVKTARPARARKEMPAALRKALIYAGVATVTFGLGFGGLKIVSGGAVGEVLVKGYLNATARAGLAVQEVLVEGRARTDGEEILSVLNLRRGAPILALDPQEAQERLEALPWIKRAVVQRQLPGIVYIAIAEREPLAIWQLRGRLSVIDGDGEEIPGAEAKRFADLPLVVGEGAPAHAAALIALLERQPDLENKVAAAVRVGDRRWNLRLDGGIDVQLPEEAAGEAWDQLARMEREHGLLGKDVVLIDLRLPDRMVVRTSGGEETTEQTPGRVQNASGEDT